MSNSVTPWTVVHQAPLCPWSFLGKNIGMDCHFLLRGIFLIQESPIISFVSCIVRWILYHYTTWDIPYSIVSQHKIYSFTVLQVRSMKWILRVWNQVIGRQCFLPFGGFGGTSVSLSFSVSRGHLHSLALVPLLCFQEPQFNLYHAVLFFCLWPSCLPHKEPSVYIGAYMCNGGYSSYLRILNLHVSKVRFAI